MTYQSLLSNVTKFSLFQVLSRNIWLFYWNLPGQRSLVRSLVQSAICQMCCQIAKSARFNVLKPISLYLFRRFKVQLSDLTTIFGDDTSRSLIWPVGFTKWSFLWSSYISIRILLIFYHRLTSLILYHGLITSPITSNPQTNQICTFYVLSKKKLGFFSFEPQFKVSSHPFLKYVSLFIGLN